MALRERLDAAELRRRLRGAVIGPDDDGYETARSTFNGLLDRRPEIVTRPLDVDDVVAAVLFARETGLPVAVRGGGHSVAGHCIGDGSLVVDLRLMRGVTVDAGARTAACEGGALWDDFDPRCQRHGLATPGGTFGDTGVGGLALGGGIGHLIGRHGLTLDNVVAATVVTADGAVVRAAETENRELFWALRGGGGNFGVVVDFTFRLHPVGRLLGGLLTYDLADAERVVLAWRELMAGAPDDLVCSVMLRRSPLGDRVDVSVAHLGDLDEGRAALRPLTEAAPVVRDTVRVMGYAELQEIFGRMPFGLRHYWSGRFLRELPDELVSFTAEYLGPEDVQGTILLEALHGEARRVPPDATAFAGREASFNATFISAWPDPAGDGRGIDVARAYSSALAPWQVGGGYLNYAFESAADGLEIEFGAARIERLRAVKRRYDPGNVFRFNHNIAP